jgi:hypothetical protein
VGLHVWHGTAKKGAILFAVQPSREVVRVMIYVKEREQYKTKCLEYIMTFRIKEKRAIIHYTLLPNSIRIIHYITEASLARNSYASLLQCFSILPNQDIQRIVGMDDVHWQYRRDEDDALGDPESPGTTSQTYEKLSALD